MMRMTMGTTPVSRTHFIAREERLTAGKTPRKGTMQGTIRGEKDVFMEQRI